MATIDSMTELLVEQLRDLYDAEKRLTKAIPKMAKAATNEQLRSALRAHLQETEQQITRLEQAFEHLDEKPRGKACAGMKGIIEEGDEHVKEDYEDDDLRDAVIIGAAQRVEHYEIAAYGTAAAHARQLGKREIVNLLEKNLQEEKAADVKLTKLAESVINIEAASDDESEQESTGLFGFGGRRQASSALRTTAAARPRKSAKSSSSSRSRGRRR
jgi:ferritin-like metal-binding protein YciE